MLLYRWVLWIFLYKTHPFCAIIREIKSLDSDLWGGLIRACLSPVLYAVPVVIFGAFRKVGHVVLLHIKVIALFFYPFSESSGHHHIQKFILNLQVYVYVLTATLITIIVISFRKSNDNWLFSKIIGLVLNFVPVGTIPSPKPSFFSPFISDQ